MKTGWARRRAPGAGARVPPVFPNHRRRLKRGFDIAKHDTPALCADAAKLARKTKTDEDRERAWGGCGRASFQDLYFRRFLSKGTARGSRRISRLDDV